MVDGNVEEKKQDEQASELKNKLGLDKSNESRLCTRKCSAGTAVLVVVIGLVVLGTAFAVGRSASRRSNRREVVGQVVGSRMMRNGGARMMGAGRRGSFGQGIVGTISKIDGNNLTVNYNDKDITVAVTADTSIIKTGEIAKQSDLATNQTVSISGASKSDGSVVATQIRIK